VLTSPTDASLEWCVNTSTLARRCRRGASTPSPKAGLRGSVQGDMSAVAPGSARTGAYSRAQSFGATLPAKRSAIQSTVVDAVRLAIVTWSPPATSTKRNR